jgi:succinate dehydrogenase / fumarate reductase cytochrome b subunit
MADPIPQKRIPAAFITRRLHSLLGLWLAVYLCEHLLVNAQAALYSYDGGAAFISMVNKIHELPYLKAIEIAILGVPFLIHGLWGIAYLRGARYNSFRTDGSTPALPQYSRNRAFTWQRITSWILLIAIIAHVIHMRFIQYPTSVQNEGKTTYLVTHKATPALYTMKEKLHLIFEENENNTVTIETPNFGTAFLLIVRESFSHPLIVILYSILVITACYHAYNGLWTAMLKWGVIVKVNTQRRFRYVTLSIMVVIMSLGLFAAWGSYFL